MPITVLGISGTIGSHVAAELLRRGHAVRGGLRDPDGPHRAWIDRHLAPLGELSLHATELTDPNSLRRCFDGCDGIVMSAGNERQEPATIGLMVGAAEHTVTLAAELGIERVVFTSSTGSTNPVGPEPEHKREMDHWSDPCDQVARGRFSPAAKTLMDATALGRGDTLGVRVAMLNPSMVLGPAFQEEAPGGLRFLARILKGEAMTAAPDGSMSVVDVRDLAALHAAALESSDARGRYFGLARSWHWQDILEALAAVHPAYTAPAWPDDRPRARPTGFDFTRRDSLGVALRDLPAILAASIEDLQRRGLV
jgi:nucleoside-diphosphate-sugar epimerase